MEPLGVRPSNLCFNKVPWWCWYTLTQVWEPLTLSEWVFHSLAAHFYMDSLRSHWHPSTLELEKRRLRDVMGWAQNQSPVRASEVFLFSQHFRAYHQMPPPLLALWEGAILEHCSEYFPMALGRTASLICCLVSWPEGALSFLNLFPPLCSCTCWNQLSCCDCQFLGRNHVAWEQLSRWNGLSLELGSLQVQGLGILPLRAWGRACLFI